MARSSLGRDNAAVDKLAHVCDPGAVTLPETSHLGHLHRPFTQHRLGIEVRARVFRIQCIQVADGWASLWPSHSPICLFFKNMCAAVPLETSGHSAVPLMASYNFNSFLLRYVTKFHVKTLI